MDRKTLDRLVPLVYAALMVLAVLFFRKAVAPVAIFGALVIAAYYIAIRPRFVAAERVNQNRDPGTPEDTRE